jgi:glycosyltransferase involved in cell wall biosynthesis
VQLPIVLHGALPRNAVFDIYRRSHFLLLPSRSEGFPKVVAEAANFGCIPIVSDVSSISQYVNDNNGYLWDTNESSFADFFCNIDLNNTKDFKNRSAEAYKMAANFTYTVYLDKLSTLILA